MATTKPSAARLPYLGGNGQDGKWHKEQQRKQVNNGKEGAHI